MKICCKCKQEKGDSEFYKNKAQPLGYDHYCIKCKKEIAKKIRDKNKDERNRKRRERRANNLEHRKKISEQKKKSYWSNIEGRLLYSTKSRAKRKKIKFELELKDIIIPKYCPILIVKFDKDRYSPTLDRIKPELGYVPGNVRVISKKANTMKNDADFSELEKFAHNIFNYIESFEDIVRTTENNKSVEVKDKEPLR